MKVSIIVPVYNVEDVLHYCVDSIIAQTYKDYELILVDDGSTDNSGMLCDKYAEQYERVTTVHLENGGVSKARNTGIELAKGEYICFIDSDDYVPKDYLETLLKAKIQFPDYDNTWCGFQTVDGYDSYKVIKKITYSDKEAISFSSTKEIMTLHEKWLDAGPVCKIYNRNNIIENKLRFPEDISLGEDLIFNYEYLCCTNGTILILNKALYNYVQTNELSLTKAFHKDLFSKYKTVHSVLLSCMDKWNCDSVQFTKYYNSCFFIYEFVLKNTFKSKDCIIRKLNHNRKIMQSEEFKNSLINSDCYINPLYKFGYKYALSAYIRVLDIITNIKNNP